MARSRKVAIYGAGGFAREVAWLLSSFEREPWEVVGFVEDGAAAGRTLNGKPVWSWDAFLASHRDAQVTVAVGDPKSRRAMVQKCEAAGLAFATLVHPRVERSEFVAFGEGAVVCAGCILTTDIHIGKDAYIGTGASIINGAPGRPIVVGDGCVVAAGACITRSTEATGLYAGVPAELKKRF